MKNDQSQTDDLFKYPLRELLGLDKQLRSIRGLLKVEVAKKVQLEEHIKKEKCKLEEFREYPGVYSDDQLEEIRNRIERLSDDLKVRQESIDLLNPIQARGVFRDPQRFLSITLRAFEIIL